MRAAFLVVVMVLWGCGDDRPGFACEITDAAIPDELLTVGCTGDFTALSYATSDGSLPGSHSVKVLLDLEDHDKTHFENTNRFINHYGFAVGHLSSANGLPAIGDDGSFYGQNQFTADRRFVMGDIIYYTHLDRYVLELSPYDTADAKMIAALFEHVRSHVFFGSAFAFHPSSDALSAQAALLPSDIPIVTTDELYAGIDYQPLSIATAIGRLRITTSAALATQYVSFQDLLVLDTAPNDLPVVAGLITQEFQTPLSHINILARNRKVPNMGLRDALSNPELQSLDGELVELAVAGDDYAIREVSQAEADEWFTSHAPSPVALPPVDLSVTTLARIADVAPESADVPLRATIQTAVRSVGGKAAHYAILRRTPGLPVRDAFAIPMTFYDRFMADNGYTARVDALLADPLFRTDPATRDAALAQLRSDMLTGTLAPELATQLQAMVAASFSTIPKLRFRSSSNSEEIDGFPCAGCYESHSGKSADLADMLDAVRQVYASVWSFRAFELRTYYGVDHLAVGMALLVHESFPDEEANGVAVTRNPLVPSAIPAFYVNVQAGGDVEVVSPPAGVTSDQFIEWWYDGPPGPIEYITHSSIVPTNTTVLTSEQVAELGGSLDAIHTRFMAAYGDNAWYGMDVEFKFDDVAAPGSPATCYIKQARPYPNPFP